MRSKTIEGSNLKIFEEFSNGYNKAIFFDENGSSSQLESIRKLLSKGKEIDNNRRYFTLTGVMFTKKKFETAIGLLNQLKKQYWDEETPVIFHTREIERREGCFSFPNVRKYYKFIDSLSNVMNLIDCKIISITFDLLSYAKDEKYTYDPYEVAFDIILEVISKNLKPRDKVALVFEARGKNEDRKLKEHICKVINKTGMKKISKDTLMKHFNEIFFNPKISSDKTKVYHGTDIADLCSYPIFRYMTTGYRRPDFDVVVSKIIGYSKAKDSTLKFSGLRKFPKKWIK